MRSIVKLDFGGADARAVRINKLEIVERLADDLAHEIKNPLHSMVINLEVLRRRIARAENGVPDELLRYVQILAGELDRVNRRVDLLLRLVRPDRESAQPATVGEVLDELQEVLQVECERREVTLRVLPSPAIDNPHLPRATTRQAILNLILHALDRVPPRGTLHVAHHAEPGWTRLLVQASGGESGGGADGDFPGGGIEVARALAESLGGRLEVPPAGLDGDGAAPVFVLSLPRG